MTKEQWAEKLTGREIGEELTTDEEKQAKRDGILIVFGASDDLCEFRGVIHDEADCYDGGTIPIHSKGPLDYKTTLPNATFEIEESGEKYCRGMVIDAKELPVL